MAKRILVPLDQTGAAEAVLPLVADAARGGGGEVRLLHVAPIPGSVLSVEGRVIAYADQEMVRLETEGLDYLRAQEVHLLGVPTDCTIRFGDPVKEILLEAEAFSADLIALTTGERRRLSQLVLGGTARRICRKTKLPVVIFRPAINGRS